MKQILAITRKELRGYFGSPMGLIFIGAFLAATMFFFFWVDAFFARGIADVRPLFGWMPLLMVFLVGALTMRQWSEEQRSGTLEILLTLPVSAVQLVAGKFLAVVVLVAISLALTISLPVTVSLMGDLDWGPVVGGYLAALLLASAYAAVGLFLSSRTDNQIVALISTVVVCGLFYLVGSSNVTDFASNAWAEVLRAVGAGSRFESIERGVIDLRDLVYYVSLTGVFLTLNVLSLISKRWSESGHTRPQRRASTVVAALLILNLVAVNVWAYPLHGARLDLTENHEYSLSPTTKDLLENLQEPLVLQGFFSEKTHPFLAPLVPQIRDMLMEYEASSGGMVRVEISDPSQDPELEVQLNQVYGITPSPFQVEGRYESSIINSYFDILIRYGDQTEHLSFNDLIEIEFAVDGTVEGVHLRSLEYDLTRTIKKVVYGFQSLDAMFAALEEPAHLTFYVTPDRLPEEYAAVPETVEAVARALEGEAKGKFTYTVIDPLAEDSPVSPQELYETYGFEPYPVSFLSSSLDESYYFHMTLEVGGRVMLVYPQGDVSEAGVRNIVESTLKRATPGFLKVVGLWTPPAEATQDLYGQVVQPLSSWDEMTQFLRDEYEVRTLDLSGGQVPVDVDVLVVISPQNMSDAERFAVDQYLMRGGAVVVAGGSYTLVADQLAGLAAQPVANGMAEMLAGYGVTVERSMVLDVQNEGFALPQMRNQVQYYELFDYPLFVDVRPNGMSQNSPIVSNLTSVTLNWVSPLTVDEEKNADRDVEVLLRSTNRSWTQNSLTIDPSYELYPEYGFPVGTDQASRVLAVSIQGVFESAFSEGAPVVESIEGDGEPEPIGSVIQMSPDSARLVVIGSAEFVDDLVFQISSSLWGDRYMNSLQFLLNAVSWGAEDLDLLSLRSGSRSVRVLLPMDERDQSIWETMNYAVALIALIVIAIVWNIYRKSEQPMALVEPGGTEPAGEEAELEVEA